MQKFEELDLRPKAEIIAVMEQLTAILELIPNHKGALHRLDLLIQELSREIHTLSSETQGRPIQIWPELETRSKLRNEARKLLPIREKQIIGYPNPISYEAAAD